MKCFKIRHLVVIACASLVKNSAVVKQGLLWFVDMAADVWFISRVFILLKKNERSLSKTYQIYGHLFLGVRNMESVLRPPRVFVCFITKILTQTWFQVPNLIHLASAELLVKQDQLENFYQS